MISGGIVAEKNSVWRVNGSSLLMRSISGDEAHVEHAIGLVDDEDLDAGHQELAALAMIEQPAGCRDQNVDAAIELLLLIAERDAADEESHVELVVLAVFVEVLLDLRREFARRFEDQRARHAGTGPALLEAG